jgi:hypothetical protein
VRETDDERGTDSPFFNNLLLLYTLFTIFFVAVYAISLLAAKGVDFRSAGKEWSTKRYCVTTRNRFFC